MTTPAKKAAKKAATKRPPAVKAPAPLPGCGTLIPLLMREIGAIAKERRNERQQYDFRGIDDVLDHVGPAAASLGLRCEITYADYKREVTSDFSTASGSKFTVHVTLRLIALFTAPDGSTHRIEGLGEAVDFTGDKATNKAMAAAFKYACFLNFIIPVEGALDDSEADEGNPHDPANAKSAGVQSSKPGAKKAAKKGAKKAPSAGNGSQAPAAADPTDRISTITTKQLNAIGAMKARLEWTDATAAEKVKLISQGATSNAAELTTEEASDMLTRMNDALARKTKNH